MAATLYALPGMGADERMFPAPWNKLPEFVAVDWSSSLDRRTLVDVARSIVETHKIKDGDVIVGTSLGGMVAAEIAQLRSLSRLILIGSAISPAEVNPLLTKLSVLADYTPIEWLQFSAASIPADLCQMFGETDAVFIRAMCHEIARWSGYVPGTERLSRIHGRYDYVIPIPSQVDYVIDGGHLIAMTHAPECVGIVQHLLQERTGSAPRSAH